MTDWYKSDLGDEWAEGQVVSGVHDCGCCGMPVMDYSFCDGCSYDCDPLTTWHCTNINGSCDGTVCEDHDATAGL